MRLVPIAVCLLLAIAANAQAGGYKKDYCDNQEYYTNSGSNNGVIYPHLHCAKNRMTYSSGSNNYDFAGGNGVVPAIANSACNKAAGQRALNLKAIIKTVCDDYEANCTDC